MLYGLGMASPELVQVAAMLRASQPREDAPLDVPAFRAYLESIGAPRPPRGVAAVAAKVAGRPAEWLVPEGVDPAGSPRLLYLHGGAYVSGSVHTHRGLAGRIARAAGCAAVVVEYRLAPEHPFPAAIDDALAALDEVATHGPPGVHGPASRLLVAGDSAGGGLTLATLLAARGRAKVAAAVTISAWTDLACGAESYVTRRDADPFIVPHLAREAGRAYLAGHDPRDPRASPLYGDLSGLPPLLMQVGDSEILLDDTLRFAQKARAAGVDVTCDVWPEMIHVWHAFPLPEGQQAIARIGEFLRSRA
jgi:acetyl esterase/lipase